MKEEEIRKILKDIEERGLLRTFRVRSSVREGRGIVDGREVWILCSNDYLSLSSHPEVISGVIDATLKYGAGSGASRLISGTTEIHREAEEKIAEFKGTEASLLFNSGYHANIGILQSLAEKDDIIFSDELNHASIIDACRLTKAEVKIFKHCDVNHLEELLKKSSGKKCKKIIVTESLFSMDGDISPLKEIVSLGKKFNAFIVVDEAHAGGVFGEKGGGLCEEMGVAEDVDVQMGTCGKAMGLFGAYAAGKKEIISLLINRARSFIFTTALPPGICGGIIKAIEVIKKEGWRREKLLQRAGLVRKLLRENNFNCLNSSSQIIPVIIGDAKMTMDISRELLFRGFFVQGIRPPAVPEGTSRLRISLNCDIREEVIYEFTNALIEILNYPERGFCERTTTS